MVNDNRKFMHDQAAAWMAQMFTAWENVRASGAVSEADFFSLKNPYFTKITSFYESDFAVATLMDKSDLIFHAEGPGAQHHAAFTNAVAWLCEEVERRIKQMAMASLGLIGKTAADAAERDLRVLLNGTAPGSLWAGFSIDSAQRMASIEQHELIETAPALEAVRLAVRALPLVPQFIGSERVDAEIADLIADPQVRDATLMAAFHLAPTGRRGIQSLEISAPRSGEPQATLTNRERVVLRETAVRQPMLRTTKIGTFVGQLREVDLDARRFQLRGVPNIGTLRCVLDDMNVEVARKHIGQGAKVTGSYEADADGRPRLMRVDRLEPFQIQREIEE